MTLKPSADSPSVWVSNGCACVATVSPTFAIYSVETCVSFVSFNCQTEKGLTLSGEAKNSCNDSPPKGQTPFRFGIQRHFVWVHHARLLEMAVTLCRSVDAARRVGIAFCLIRSQSRVRPNARYDWVIDLKSPAIAVTAWDISASPAKCPCSTTRR